MDKIQIERRKAQSHPIANGARASGVPVQKKVDGHIQGKSADLFILKTRPLWQPHCFLIV
jgi:hypothetical protein